MSNAKPTAATDKNRNDNAFMIRLLAAGYILYMLIDTIRSFIAGGEEAPTVFVLILSIVVLGGGAAFILISSWKQYQKNKKNIAQQEELAKAEAEQDQIEAQTETFDEDAPEDTL